MPTSVVYLDDDNNIVPPDLATVLVENETDDQGRSVAERWVKIVRPGSPEEELVEIIRDSERIADDTTPDMAKRPMAGRAWLILAIVVLAALALWVLLS